ncbi:MAG: methyltransferase domain-containing protein, partial [Nitrospira sp.]
MAPRPKSLTQASRELYGLLCGTGTNLNVFHYQYMAMYKLYPELKSLLQKRSGSVFDFGCGTKPFKADFKETTDYIGADLEYTKEVDIQIVGGVIPELNQKFDYVLATQVFEHTEHLDYIRQLFNILKPGGEIIITVPFLYHVHDEYDFRRFTLMGIERVLLDAGYETVYKKAIGGVGSTT